jgi:hypothetical protein
MPSRSSSIVSLAVAPDPGASSTVGIPARASLEACADVGAEFHFLAKICDMQVAAR